MSYSFFHRHQIGKHTEPQIGQKIGILVTVP